MGKTYSSGIQDWSSEQSWRHFTQLLRWWRTGTGFGGKIRCRRLHIEFKLPQAAKTVRSIAEHYRRYADEMDVRAKQQIEDD